VTVLFWLGFLVGATAASVAFGVALWPRHAAEDEGRRP